MKKKYEISFLNTLFCVLVVFIHVASAPVTALEKNTLQWFTVFIPWRLSAFVVQGFIFLSGMKMFLHFKTDEKFDYKKYYISRLKKIVLPYVFCVCLFYVYFLRHGYFNFDFSDLLLYILNGTLVSHFYFVVVIVQFYLLRPLWQKMLRNVSAVCAILVSAAVTVFALYFQQTVLSSILQKNFVFNDRVFTTYLIYWILGCYAGANYSVFFKLLERIKTISIEFFAVTAAELVLSYLHFSGLKNIAYLELVHVVYCVSAIAFFSAVSLKISESIMKIKIFASVDRLSYYIYLIHPLLIIIADDKMNQLKIYDFGIAFVLRGIAAYVGTITVCWVYQWIKNKMTKNV